MNSPTTPHIVTITMNPALDIHSSVPILQATEKMRCSRPRYDPGGGGINVARAAVRLGVPATAVFTSGGPTGARIEALLAAEGIATGPLGITGASRESLTVREVRTGQEYRFVLPAPRPHRHRGATLPRRPGRVCTHCRVCEHRNASRGEWQSPTGMLGRLLPGRVGHRGPARVHTDRRHPRPGSAAGARRRSDQAEPSRTP